MVMILHHQHLHLGWLCSTLRALAVTPEDLSSTLSLIQVLEDPTPSAGIFGYVVHRHTYRQNTYKHETK